MDAIEFEKVTGYKPVMDDLERANCKETGIGHSGCGVCFICGKPKFLCVESSHSEAAARIAALEAQIAEANEVIRPFAENYNAFVKTNDASNIRKGWFSELQRAAEYIASRRSQ